MKNFPVEFWKILFKTLDVFIQLPETKRNNSDET